MNSAKHKIYSKLRYKYLNQILTQRLKGEHDVNGLTHREIIKTKEKSRMIILNANMLQKPFFSRLFFFNYPFYPWKDLRSKDFFFITSILYVFTVGKDHLF